jgi:CBS domain-containing protein
MQISEIMKRNVRVIAEGDDARAAARLMRDEDVGLLAVCDGRGGVVGVLTDRDIALRVCVGRDPPNAVLVRTVMTKNPICCRPTHRVAHAEALMRRHRVTRILVIDDAGKLVGIVSLSDIAHYEPPSKVGAIFRSVAERKYAPERP